MLFPFVILAAQVPATSSGIPGSPAVWILGVILGLFTAVGGGYFVSRRVNSGRIDTTEASRLWDESQAMRKELRDETVLLRTHVDTLTGKVDLLTMQNQHLTEAHAECRRNEALLQVKLERLEARMSRSRVQKNVAGKPRKTS